MSQNITPTQRQPWTAPKLKKMDPGSAEGATGDGADAAVFS